MPWPKSKHNRRWRRWIARRFYLHTARKTSLVFDKGLVNFAHPIAGQAIEWILKPDPINWGNVFFYFADPSETDTTSASFRVLQTASADAVDPNVYAAKNA